MAEYLKVLAQSNPSINILTDIYTVPNTRTGAAISSMIICNLNNSTPINFSVSVAINGAADAAKQYLYKNIPVQPYDTFVATLGISLATNDVLRVTVDNGNVAINVCGIEVG